MSLAYLRERKEEMCLEDGELEIPEREAGATMVRIVDFNLITIECHCRVLSKRHPELVLC